ncbi:MAG: NUDIX domain-containing protein [Pseudomonadota bacterium]|nr:NUDIX domain-containing protein [Pseudomonadota bacterium]
MPYHHTLIHPEFKQHLTQSVLFKRQAARGIVLRDAQILLLFTERYNDFSFPGGGVDPDEPLEMALRRELAEETGAQDVCIQQYYGQVEEFRPYHKAGYDGMHMISHFFVCDIAAELQAVQMEQHEIANGMRPVWVDLQQAIAHNQAIIQRQDSTMGQSIHRETLMLRQVAEDLV